MHFVGTDREAGFSRFEGGDGGRKDRDRGKSEQGELTALDGNVDA
jgi:hypothetical protein